jgi:AraC-like DNA-binding protein
VRVETVADEPEQRAQESCVDRALASIAREVGYDDELAFSTAFRRLRGSAPGRYRRSAGAGATAEVLTSSP